MLSIHGLTKTYPTGVRAINAVSLEIPPGVFGLLGPNGAGKSTLMKILATLLDPDAGEITLGNVDVLSRPRASRRLLGYLPQDFGFYPTLTAEQTLDYLAKLKGMADRRQRRAMCDDLLERVNLTAARRRRVGEFSGGMVQRLGIAQAMIGEPSLIIVDEPTAGLDPEERNRFHNLLAEAAERGAVVILSTHIVSDIAGLSQRMAIIRGGEIIAACTPSEAIDQMTGTMWEALVLREQVASLATRIRIVSTQMSQGRVRVRAYAPQRAPTEEFSPATPTLEDFYLVRVGGVVQ